MNLGETVKVMYATGDANCLGKIVAKCDAPTFILEDDRGVRFSWRIDLCKEATPVEKASFSRKRDMKLANCIANCPHCGQDIKLTQI